MEAGCRRFRGTKMACATGYSDPDIMRSRRHTENQIYRTVIPVGLDQPTLSLEVSATVQQWQKQCVNDSGVRQNIRQMQLQQAALIIAIEKTEPRLLNAT